MRSRDGDVGTYDAAFVFCRVLDQLKGVGVAGTRATQSMDTVLVITSSSMVTVCNWMLIPRKGLSEQASN